MAFHLIDRETWPRKEHFEHYMASPCTYSMTEELDASHLIEKVKGKGLSFYPVMLYGIARIVNAHQEFRMALDEEGNLGYYDIRHPSYTVFHPETETFSTLWTEYSPEFEWFYRNYQEDKMKYGNSPRFLPKPGVANLFDVSCIPWTSFTGFNLNLKQDQNYFAPIITFGRYESRRDRMMLPLSLQVNHAVCDGFHAARFFNELKVWAAAV